MGARYATEAEELAFRDGMSVALSFTGALADGGLRAALVPQDHQAPLTLEWLATALPRVDPLRLAVLRPFDPSEACEIKQAAGRADVSDSAMRDWTNRYGIGRRVVGRLLVSRPALEMLLDENAPALAAYLVGDRGPLVAPYFERAGLCALQTTCLKS